MGCFLVGRYFSVVGCSIYASFKFTVFSQSLTFVFPSAIYEVSKKYSKNSLDIFEAPSRQTSFDPGFDPN